MSGRTRTDRRNLAVSTLTIGVLLFSAAPGASQQTSAYTPIERQDPAPFADRFLDAYRADDEAALEEVLERALAELQEPDPFLLAHELFARHVRGSLGAPPEPGDFLEACTAFSERAAGSKASEALPQLVTTWRELDRTALEREARLLDLLATARVVPANSAAILDGLKVLHVDLTAEPPSATAALLLLEGACAAHALGRFEENCGYLEEADEVAEALGWPHLRIRALYLAGLTHLGTNSAARALECQQLCLAICEEAELWGEAAESHNALGEVQLRTRRIELAAAHFERAVELHEGQGDEEAANVARGNLAIVCFERGELDRALEIHLELQDYWRGRGRLEYLANGQEEIGLIHYQQGRGEEALAAFEAASDLHEELGDSQPRIHHKIGGVLEQLERYPEAINSLTLALEQAAAASDAYLEAAASESLGIVYMRMRQNQRARELLEAALLAKEALGNRGGMAITRVNLSGVLRGAGSYADALHHLELARAEFESLGALLFIPSVDANTGNVYLELNLVDEAVLCYERALEAFEARGQVAESVSPLLKLGELATREGDFARAHAFLERAERAARSAAAPSSVAIVRGTIALAYESEGRYEEAAPVRAEARRVFLELGLRDNAARCLVRMGVALWEQGDAEQGLALLSRALEELEPLEDPELRAGTLHERAHIHLELGRPAEALRDARRSIELRMECLRGLAEAEGLFLRRDVYCGAGDGLVAAHDLAALGGEAAEPDLEETLWFVESGRSLTLAEVLSNRDALLEAHLPRELLDALSFCRARVDSLNRHLSGLRASGAPDKEQLEAARTELEGAQDELGRLVTRVQREARGVADVLCPTPIGLAAVQQLLGPREALVYYQLCEEGLFALVVRPDRAELVRLGGTPDTGAAVQRYSRLVGVAGSEERSLARELYDVLLAPLEDQLADRARILIAPDGPLTFLPFEALLGRGEGGEQRAIERWELAYVHSGTVLRALQEESGASEPGTGLLALGDPLYPGESEASDDPPERPSLASLMRGEGHLPRLVGSGAEVRAIAELFPAEERAVHLRERATLSALREAAALHEGRFAALHLACHGILDSERPRLTGLVLAHGETLTADHLVRTRLPADLAVLSACDSGRGEILNGEGVLGLVRAFFFAGCPRVVVSNWRVDDQSTRALMIAFYHHMRAGGLAPSAALRAAKLERLRAGGETAHPYHWASFVLWGLGE